MAERDIVVTGWRWELFAAAYEVAVDMGSRIRIDRSLASFTFVTKPLLHGNRRDFEVWVSEIEALRCVVHIECTVKRWALWQSWAYEREARRALRKFVERFERQRLAARNAYAPAGWYRVPDAPGKRFWNGLAWTPWRWVNDGVVLDAPGGYAFAVEPEFLGVVGASGEVPNLDGITTVRLAPPFASPKQVVGVRRWRLRRIRDVAFVAGALALFLWLLYLYIDAL